MGMVKRRRVRENRRKGFEQKLFFMYSCHKHFLSMCCVIHTGDAVMSKMGIAFDFLELMFQRKPTNKWEKVLCLVVIRALENIGGIRWVKKLVWGKGGL